MATTADVATSLSVTDPARTTGAPTPTTPRPTSAFPPPPNHDTTNNNESGPRTPTGQDSENTTGQSSQPADPMTPAHHRHTPMEPPNTAQSQRSATSQLPVQSQDVEMGEVDDPAGGEEDGSDNDSVTSESQRLSKKKKGQRFFCTDFPPCQLSFTRSEHLARHIRKHTGERPFQCHCSRRFSRLDNLRQHAQTVHIGEEIPDGSLAATSTRFQRQIRTDRVRPPGSRSRASTIGSNSGHGRGHSRNVSTSSIGSTSSSITGAEESRKRPLAMATDPSSRPRLPLETYSQMPGGAPQYAYYNQSPTGYSTPTSTVYSTEVGSPRFGSNMASPISTMSRSSFYEGPGHARRLSVPSAHNPFQSAAGSTYPPPYYGALMQMNSMSTFSPQGSMFGSPTSSVFSHTRRDSETDSEWRRRTWHPGTHTSYSQRPATSGLSYHQTPDDKQPAASEQPAASQLTRLPGIESFDHAARQQTSPMMIDTSPRPTSSGQSIEVPPPPAPPQQPQPMARLDIAAANDPIEGQWQVVPPHDAPQQAYYPPPQSMQQRPPPPAAPMPEPVTPRRNKRQAWYGGPVNQAPHPPPNVPPSQAPQQQQQQQQQQQHPAYATHGPSPEDSGSSDGIPTPSTSQANEYHPVIVNPASGMPEPLGIYAGPGGPVLAAAAAEEAAGTQQGGGQGKQTYALQTGHEPAFASAAAAAYPHHHHDNHNHNQHAARHVAAAPSNHDMGRLEALVAVATSEGRAVERS